MVAAIDIILDHLEGKVVKPAEAPKFRMNVSENHGNIFTT